MSGSAAELIKESLKTLPKHEAQQIKQVLVQKLKSEKTLQAEAKLVNQSIHPRIVGSRQRFDKVDTCKPRRAPNSKKIANMNEHQIRHPNDSASKAHLAKIMARG